MGRERGEIKKVRFSALVRPIEKIEGMLCKEIGEVVRFPPTAMLDDSIDVELVAEAAVRRMVDRRGPIIPSGRNVAVLIALPRVTVQVLANERRGIASVIE